MNLFQQVRSLLQENQHKLHIGVKISINILATVSSLTDFPHFRSIMTIDTESVFYLRSLDLLNHFLTAGGLRDFQDFTYFLKFSGGKDALL